MALGPTLDTALARTMRLGELLAYYRTTAGYSQNALARRAAIDHSLLHRYELGERRPSRGRTLALARALGLSQAETDELLQAAGLAPESEQLRQLIVSLARCADPVRLRKGQRLLETALETLTPPVVQFDD
ncbi:MAG TPA: helix-turn-helix transcriptional regulator [Tepidisphaeraceae bacterium]|jgi:transcriptional regulator with XRE-family HTH domain